MMWAVAAMTIHGELRTASRMNRIGAGPFLKCGAASGRTGPVSGCGITRMVKTLRRAARRRPMPASRAAFCDPSRRNVPPVAAACRRVVKNKAPRALARGAFMRRCEAGRRLLLLRRLGLLAARQVHADHLA